MKTRGNLTLEEAIETNEKLRGKIKERDKVIDILLKVVIEGTSCLCTQPYFYCAKCESLDHPTVKAYREQKK